MQPKPIAARVSSIRNDLTYFVSTHPIRNIFSQTPDLVHNIRQPVDCLNGHHVVTKNSNH